MPKPTEYSSDSSSDRGTQDGGGSDDGSGRNSSCQSSGSGSASGSQTQSSAGGSRSSSSDRGEDKSAYDSGRSSAPTLASRRDGISRIDRSGSVTLSGSSDYFGVDNTLKSRMKVLFKLEDAGEPAPEKLGHLHDRYKAGLKMSLLRSQDFKSKCHASATE